MATGGDDWERRKALKEAPELRAELEELHKKVSTLEKEKEDMTSKMRATEHNNNDLSTRNVELEKEIQTQQTKRAHLEQQLKLSEAESERLQREREDLQTKRAHLEQQLQETTAESARLQRELDTQASQFARMMASKDRERSEAARRAQAAEKSLAVTERHLGVLKAEQQEKLEQLHANISNIQEQLGQHKDRQADVLEGVSFLVQRQKDKDLDLGSVLTSLEPELRQLCVRIERHVGCRGVEFSERLLGGHHDPRDEEIWKHHGFLTRHSFWRLVRRWTVVSLQPGSQAALTLHHLQNVCSSLQPDPRSVSPITAAHEAVLERNFAFLSEQLDFDAVLNYIISFNDLNDIAREFLMDKSLETRFQKTARLLDVVYSLGEAGYRQLRDVMGPSGHDHVLGIFPQEADVSSRQDADRRRTEAVADAGPDDDGNVNSVVAADDDNADEEGPGEVGDDGALDLHDLFICQ